MNHRIRKAMLAALKLIKHDESLINKKEGICGNLDDVLYEIFEYEAWHEAYDHTGRLASKWPKHSGNRSYPVPHPEYGPEIAFDLTDDLWDRNTQYGRDRWELLEFMIEKLEKQYD